MTAEDPALELQSERLGHLQELLLSWYAGHARDLPWRRTRDPYGILVSEIMLQQTQVDRVAPKYEQFLAEFPTLAALADAPTADVIRAWAPLGYNRRAINLQRAAREVLARFGGSLPSEPAILKTLPGIGTYTAAAVACFAFGRAEPVVDTNVRRVIGRVDGAATLTERQTLELARAYLALDRPGQWNQALMDLGATICGASAPRCLVCPLRRLCRSSGRVVRESRAAYKARAQERFEDSDRYLRGRIIDALRARESIAVLELSGMLKLERPEDGERLERLIGGLQRDGLLVRDGEGVRLP